MELDVIMNKLTPYWAWYKQRVIRMLRSEKLPSDVVVRHWDWRRREMYDLLQPLVVLKIYQDLIPEHMITHLPHRCLVTYRVREGHSWKTRWYENDQEIWCATHVGKRDRDWLYLGKHEWAFRTAEQSCEFTLAWS